MTYEQQPPNVSTELRADEDPETVMATFGPQKRLESERGDAEAAFAAAPVKIDQTYVTPTETHNPLELHAAIAMWDRLPPPASWASTRGRLEYGNKAANCLG